MSVGGCGLVGGASEEEKMALISVIVKVNENFYGIIKLD